MSYFFLNGSDKWFFKKAHESSGVFKKVKTMTGFKNI